VTTPTWSTLSIDTTLALRAAASRLADEFTGTFGIRPIRDDIERRVRQLIDELALTPAADQRVGRR
jgi:hypothetical protein